MARRSSAYLIEYSPEAEDHLRYLTKDQQARVLDTVDRQLAHQPTIETRNRKRMRPNPVAPWELRIAELRVYYDVEDEPRKSVKVMAVGKKDRNTVRIAGDIIEVRKIELAKASAPLSEYAVEVKNDPIVIVKHGRPMAAVIPLRNTDAETVALSTNKSFLGIIKKSRQSLKTHGGISPKELRRRLALKK